MFANPPLIELIAELRWIPGQASPVVPGSLGPGIQFPLVGLNVEQTFSNFSNQVAQRGFGLSERLVPPGFPYIPFSVAYRFRKSPSQRENFLYQIGSGIFSANALPPYREWDRFRPVVREGVGALLISRHESENGDFTSIILRYIDLFSDEFTEGRSSFNFLNELLGIRIELPNVVRSQTQDLGKVQAGLQISLPLSTGLQMNLNFQQGQAAGKTGIIMTTEVFTVSATPAQLEPVMQTFDNAH
ncbi:MAG: TIGR04255 family protein, partial [Acidobacteria bacterium]|nr:TIGR04255 family protein [Acidobacteriota bacterium]